MLLKICGMRQAENIRTVEKLGIDLMGFIFYPRSPRYAGEEPEYLPAGVGRVGVFVDEYPDNIRERVERFRLDYVQLHGDETPEYCLGLKRSGLRLIKAFSVAGAEDLAATDRYAGLCDYFLFDTKTSGYGGSGRTFDWSLLENYRGETPFLLSGGLGPDSLPSLAGFRHEQLAGYDLNSRFETAPGMKDPALLEEFIRKIR